MENLDRHKTIRILFGYIDDYEGGGKFVAEEFVNYFENVLSHLKLIRDQNSLEIIKAVDDALVSQFAGTLYCRNIQGFLHSATCSSKRAISW